MEQYGTFGEQYKDLHKPKKSDKLCTAYQLSNSNSTLCFTLHSITGINILRHCEFSSRCTRGVLVYGEMF